MQTTDNAHWAHDHESEAAVLACCFIVPDCVKLSVSLLTPDDFHHPTNRAIFTAIGAINTRGELPTALLVRDWLKAHSPALSKLEYIGRLTELVPIYTEIRGYCILVREHSNRRRLEAEIIKARSRLQNSEPAADVAHTLTQSAGNIKEIGKLHLIGDSIDDTLTQWGNFKRTTDSAPRWYLREMDALLGPLHGSQAIVIAGAGKSGKTTLLWRQALSFAMSTHRTAFFSLEMSRAQMHARLVQYQAMVNPFHLKLEQMHIAEDSLNSFRDLPLYINDRPQTLATLMSGVRQHALAGCKLIFVDYLGLVRNTGKENLNTHLGATMQALKGVAMEFEIDVIIGCQLNRLSRKERRAPELYDLRDSGNIEQDSDLIIMLDRVGWREENALTQIDIKGNRHGDVGSFTVNWDHRSKVYIDSAAQNVYE